jgi:catechol 2,3-dioxygenase-like lactoylglutathione lyase family enzyme
MSLSALGQIALTVTDLDAAVAFYKEKLGLPFLFSAPPKLAFFDLDGVRLMIGEPENEAQATGNSVLYFRVDDIHQTYKSLLERGVPFDDRPHLVARLDSIELWMAFFRDPDHNLMGIMSEIPITETAK